MNQRTGYLTLGRAGALREVTRQVDLVQPTGVALANQDRGVVAVEWEILSNGHHYLFWVGWIPLSISRCSQIPVCWYGVSIFTLGRVAPHLMVDLRDI